VKRSAQQRANLRCCASCEWIYEGLRECPKCGFASYGARYVHGDRAYRYKKTQEPWMNKKIDRYAVKLLGEIVSANTQISGGTPSAVSDCCAKDR